MELYDTVNDTRDAVKKILASSKTCSDSRNYCTWIHSNIPGNCSINHASGINYRAPLHRLLCNDTRSCEHQLCN